MTDTNRKKDIILHQKNEKQDIGFYRHDGNTDHVSLNQHMGKITQALYMITDLIDDEVSLKSVIRNGAVSIGQSLSILLGTQKSLQDIYIKIQNQLAQLSTSFDLMYQYHNVSDMNYQIVHSELGKMYNAISALISVGNKNAVQGVDGLDASFFVDNSTLNQKPVFAKPTIQETSLSLKQTSKAPTNTKTENPSFIVKDTIKQNVSVDVKPDVTTVRVAISAKEKRHTNILNILKQKKNASINDICSLFKGCSSKTIQRDLVNLIDQKKVVKRGDRRWSTYNLA